MTKYDCREVQSDKLCEEANKMAAKDVPIKFDGICDIKWDEHEFREALRMVCHYFNVDELFAEQAKILRSSGKVFTQANNYLDFNKNFQ